MPDLDPLDIAGPFDLARALRAGQTYRPMPTLPELTESGDPCPACKRPVWSTARLFCNDICTTVWRKRWWT